MKAFRLSSFLFVVCTVLQASDFASTKKLAEQGDAMAQFNLEVMYAKGEGVIEDFVATYAWLSNTKANGDKQAVKAIAIVKKSMTKEQIAVGQVLAKKLFEETQNRDDESPVHKKYD